MKNLTAVLLLAVSVNAVAALPEPEVVFPDPNHYGDAFSLGLAAFECDYRITDNVFNDMLSSVTHLTGEYLYYTGVGYKQNMRKIKDKARSLKENYSCDQLGRAFYDSLRHGELMI